MFKKKELFLTPQQAAVVESYMKKFCKLSPDQVHNLLIQYNSTGDKKALEMVVKANIKYVVSIALQHTTADLDLSELIEQGLLGLMEAVCRYDTSSSTKFTTFAFDWINKHILDFKFRYSTPFSHHENKDKDDEADRVLDMDATYMAGHEVYVKRELEFHMDSLSRVIGDDGDDTYTLEETIGVEDTTVDDDFRRMECRKALEDGLKKLTNREALIFRLCNGFGCKKESHATIAQMLGLKSAERVKQLNAFIKCKLATIIDPSVLD